VIELNKYERYSAPSQKGSVLLLQQEPGFAEPERADPNTWSKDGTVRQSTFAPSKDAAYAVYGISRSGSDWQEYKVMELATRKSSRIHLFG
jgi:prolyl oligopeptidase